MDIRSMNKTMIAVLIGLALLILALCCALFFVLLLRQPGLNFAAILSNPTPSPTATSTMEPTLTPVPTFTHTPVPTQEPKDYPLNNACMQIVSQGSPRLVLNECVSSITVLSDGRMQFNFTWKVESGSSKHALQMYPDTGNRNMYITDSLGNRIDHLETGGQANETVALFDGDTKQGWFVFPPADPQAQPG